MKCRYCNNDLGKTAKFCTKCGREVDLSKDESATDILKQIDEATEALEKTMTDTENTTVSEKPEKTPEIINTPEPAKAPEPAAIPRPEPVADPMPDVSDNISENTDYMTYESIPVKVGFGRLFGASLVGFLAFLILVIFSILCCLKVGVSGNTVSKCISRMNIVQFADADVNGKSVADNLYELTEFGNSTEDHATGAEFRDFLIRTDFMDFVNIKSSAYINYIFNGKGNEPTVTTNEMIEFLQNNSMAGRDAFGAQLINAEYNAIRKQLERKEVAQNLLISTWGNKLGVNLSIVKFMFQIITLAIISAILVLIMIWISAIVKKRSRYILGSIGNILLYSGIVVFAVSLLASVGSSVFYVINGSLIAYACSYVLLPFSLFAAATGVFEFILGFILRKIRKVVVRKEKENA